MRGDRQPKEPPQKPPKEQVGLLPSELLVRLCRLGNRCGVRRWQAHLWEAHHRGDRSAKETPTQRTRPGVLPDFPNPLSPMLSSTSRDRVSRVNNAGRTPGQRLAQR
ncbi:MAG: hypothetical protein SNJ81_05265 [Cyanobacteriota bacterium]